MSHASGVAFAAAAAYTEAAVRHDAESVQKATEWYDVGDFFRLLLCSCAIIGVTFVLVRICLLVGLARRKSPKQPFVADDVSKRFPVCRTDREPTCAVCLSPVSADEECRQTDCGHEFHADCIMQWWTHKPRKTLKCPVCRQRQRRQPDHSQEGDPYKREGWLCLAVPL